MMMAALATRMAAFTKVLLRIGFNGPIVDEVNGEGFNTITNLLAISDEQIHSTVKHIGNWRERVAAVAPVAGMVAPQAVNFPFLVLHRFKALRYWVLLRNHQGAVLNTINADEYTEDISVTTMQHIQEGVQIRTTLKDQVPTKPTKLGLDIALAKVLGAAQDLPVAMQGSCLHPNCIPCLQA
jgi:hypothetical protein